MTTAVNLLDLTISHKSFPIYSWKHTQSHNIEFCKTNTFSTALAIDFSNYAVDSTCLANRDATMQKSQAFPNQPHAVHPGSIAPWLYCNVCC
eukprot:6478180-Amphidinium_carterae.1